MYTIVSKIDRDYTKVIWKFPEFDIFYLYQTEISHAGNYFYFRTIRGYSPVLMMFFSLLFEAIVRVFRGKRHFLITLCMHVEWKEKILIGNVLSSCYGELNMAK